MGNENRTGQYYKTTVRWDLSRPDERAAYDKIQNRAGGSLSQYVAAAVLAYEDAAGASCHPEFVRKIVREELQKAMVSPLIFDADTEKTDTDGTDGLLDAADEAYPISGKENKGMKELDAGFQGLDNPWAEEPEKDEGDGLTLDAEVEDFLNALNG